MKIFATVLTAIAVVAALGTAGPRSRWPPPVPRDRPQPVAAASALGRPSSGWEFSLERELVDFTLVPAESKT